MPQTTPEHNEPSGTSHPMHALARQAALAEDINPEIRRLVRTEGIVALPRALRSVGLVSTGEDHNPADLSDVLDTLTITGPKLLAVSTTDADEPPVGDGNELWSELLEESSPTTWEQEGENESNNN